MKQDNAIYVTKPFLPPLEEFVQYLDEIWETGILTNNGPKHRELEKGVMSRFGWRNTSLLTNGHLALEIALKAMDLKLGGEIITTPFTFVSTTAAIVNQGFVPVFCDIKDNCTIDPSKIESLITDKTVAILPVHVYGIPCDVESIEKIAKKHNLKVLYDAAHAFGVKSKGKDISSYGDISMFSFHATKLFHTIEGGALVYSNPKLKECIDLIKNFGISGPESIELVGMNAKMNEFQAAMGLLLLRYFDDITRKRKAIYERYIQNLNGVDGIEMFKPDDDTSYNYAYMPVLFESNRDVVFKYLESKKIFARKYFFPCISKVESYKKYLRGDSLANAEKKAEQVITLPIYPELTIEQVDYICQNVLEAMKEKR